MTPDPSVDASPQAAPTVAVTADPGRAPADDSGPDERRPSEPTRVQALFYSPPELTDGRITLRPAGADDAAALYPLLQDRETLLLTGSTHSSARADRIVSGEIQPWGSPEKLAEDYDAWSVADDRAVWVIEEDATIVGEMVLMDLDPPNISCALRLWITGATDRGIGTAALTLALDWAFRTVELHRVSLDVFEHNPRAIHVYEKLGFVREGTMREALWQDGRWIDSLGMGILRREWLARQDG